MKRFLVAVVLVANFPCNGYTQTNYYKYDATTGTSQKVGYSEPANTASPFSTYRGTVDPAVYMQVGMMKQRQYDNNFQLLKLLVDEIGTILNEIYQYDTKYWEEASTIFRNYLSTIKNYDFGNQQTFNSVYGYLSETRSILNNNKKIVIDNYYKRKYQNTQSETYKPSPASNEKTTRNYTGTVEVSTCSPVLQHPDIMSEHLVAACNGKVTILKRYSEMFYFVEYQGKKGYLHYGWIK